jgi:threonine/homoserine/homoserine lactone efflux protein
MLDLTDALVFIAAYAMAVATPGPGIAALVARVLARGTRGIAPFIAGFLVGDFVWFTIAATGLAVLAQNFATLFVVLKYAGAAYLLWIAWKLWSAPAVAVDEGAAPAGEGAGRLFTASLLLTLGNPKVILFFMALLPSVLDLEAMTPGVFAQVGALLLCVLGGVLCAYTLAAARARRLFTTPRAVRAVNRGAGVAIAGAAVVVVAR